MKSILKCSAVLLVMLTLFGDNSVFALTPRTDSLSYWRFHINGNELIATEAGELFIDLEKLNDVELFYIRQFTAQPCADCTGRILMNDDKGRQICTVEKSGYGDMPPFTMHGADLKFLLRQYPEGIKLYFSGRDEGSKRWKSPKYLGAIKTNISSK